MAACSICRNPSAKALIDGAVLSGSTPIDAWRQHGEGLGISLAATYRHTNRHSARGIIAPNYLGDLTTGEVLADQAALVRSFIVQRSNALDRGDNATAAREGALAQNALTTLIKAGIPNEDAATTLHYFDKIGRTLQLRARQDPDALDALAAVADSVYDKELADDLRSVAQIGRDYNSTTNKEK
ncbi:MAG: hypothetical protein JWQ89_4306 [Devosia sp.]|uniref:hypothetical protein n=1 Tax=Devosia sp. TaxID=1871048 RepID=UPI00260DB7D5|nr:hypothetical protein [Devosia sp.]MDB5542579.1 hypothetical protein [Devosia sp.]